MSNMTILNGVFRTRTIDLIIYFTVTFIRFVIFIIIEQDNFEFTLFRKLVGGTRKFTLKF